MKFSCWTPRYVRDRLHSLIYEKTHPEYPWLTKTANIILESWLRPDDIGLEFGSGRSTLWFAARITLLMSVEHDQKWCDWVLEQIKQKNIKNVDYRFINIQGEKNFDECSDYIEQVQGVGKNSLDFVLVDGIYRDACANAVLDLIKPGGFLIVDNANWFLPSNSMSPNSRSHTQGPASVPWERFLARVCAWRSIWTTSGVTDTVFFLKPCPKNREIYGK